MNKPKLPPNTWPVGFKFHLSDKHNAECTIEDCLLTFNLKGEHVKTRYVCTYQFCGKTITDFDVPSSTIEREQARTRSKAGKLAAMDLHESSPVPIIPWQDYGNPRHG
jgi:hypothetical protein